MVGIQQLKLVQFRNYVQKQFEFTHRIVGIVGSNGTGTGGPGYKIQCELDGENQYHDRGVLSMAHAGRNTGGSQFFICHSRANTGHLDRNHTCFGKVVEGLDVIDAIRGGDKIEKILIHES